MEAEFRCTDNLFLMCYLQAISPGRAEADFFRRIYGDKYVEETALFNELTFSSQEVANALLTVLANS